MFWCHPAGKSMWCTNEYPHVVENDMNAHKRVNACNKEHSNGFNEQDNALG